VSARDRRGEEEVNETDDSSAFSPPPALQSFIGQPRRFVLGAVFSALVAGLTGAFGDGIDAIRLVFLGSAPTRSFPAEESWGIVDMLLWIPRGIGGIGSSLGGEIVGLIRGINEPLLTLAADGGVLAGVIVTAAIVVEMVVVLFVLERLARVLIDLVPGLGGLI